MRRTSCGSPPARQPFGEPSYTLFGFASPVFATLDQARGASASGALPGPVLLLDQ